MFSQFLLDPPLCFVVFSALQLCRMVLLKVGEILLSLFIHCHNLSSLSLAPRFLNCCHAALQITPMWQPSSLLLHFQPRKSPQFAIQVDLFRCISISSTWSKWPNSLRKLVLARSLLGPNFLLSE